MKLGLALKSQWQFCVVSLCVALVMFLWVFPGASSAEVDNVKNVDKLPGASWTPTKKANGNSNGHRTSLPLECPEKDEECETDRQGLEAIRSLHLLIDDDHNGNVDQHESDEFLRDELQYTDGFERQALFHNNDKLISVDDLWRAWKFSVVHNWTTEDVQEWLAQDVELPQYAASFAANNIDGSVLPRLVNSTSTLLTALGIRNMHKQRLALKAMDTVLFGAPKRVHSFTKDLLLVSSLILAVGGCWFACLHHRYSQTQVRKMMKDLESLQKAEDALKKLSNELADAEKNQTSLSQEKQEEFRMLRQSSVRLKVPRLGSTTSAGDKSPSTLSREGSVLRRQEGEKKLKEAEEELSALREALTEAESRLELQQQLESQWSVPGELQAWLQLTHELEMQQHSLKKAAAERQRLAARDGCDKIKKRNKAFFGSLRIAHSNSLDDIEQSIMDARAALEEVRQDLQESQQRWQIMEILCGFPIIVNPGLAALRQALGRDPSGNLTRGTASLLPPSSIDEAEEDLPPTASRKNRGYASSTLGGAGKSSTFLKQQTMAGSTSSLPHAAGNTSITTTPSTVATTLPRRDSRDTDLMLRSATEAGPAASTTFHLGTTDSAMYPSHERTPSNASLSMVSPMLTNGHHHSHHHPQHLRAPYGQSLSHPPFHMPPSASTPHMLAAGASNSNLTNSAGIPHRSKMFTSHSGNHLAAMKQMASSSVVSSPAGGRNGTGPVTGVSYHKQQTSEDIGSLPRQESGDSNGNTIMYSSDSTGAGTGEGDSASLRGVLMRSQAHCSSPVDNSDRMSVDSLPSRSGQSTLVRSRLDRTPELDLSSVETDSVYSSGLEGGVQGTQPSPAEKSTAGQAGSQNGAGTLEKRSSKRKKFLPNFLQKGKGKHKTS